MEIEVFNQLELVEQAGLLYVKGYNARDISEILEVSERQAKDAVRDYQAIVEQRVESDPFFLEKIQYNTLKALDEMSEVTKEIWETVQIATEGGMVSARIQALKLAMEAAQKKAQLLQLMGGGKGDAEYVERMQKAESVNQIISKVVRDVVADCETCRPKAHALIREAYALMNEEAFNSPQEVADHLSVQNVESFEEDDPEHDHF